MSIKIYDAYKVIGKGDLWNIIWAIEDQATENVVQALKDLYWDMMIRVDLQDPEYLKNANPEDPGNWYSRISHVRRKIQEKYKEARESPYPDDFNFDVTIAVSPYKGFLYVRAFADRASRMSGVLAFLNDHPRLRDYHYQNSCDMPKGVSKREWSRRRRTWEALCNPKTDVIRHVSLDICSKNKFWQIDPYVTLCQSYRATPPVFPTPEEVSAQDLVKEKFQNVHSEPGLVTAEKRGKSYRIFLRDGWHIEMDGEIVKNESRESFEKLEYATGHVAHYLGLSDNDRAMIDRMIARYKDPVSPSS